MAEINENIKPWRREISDTEWNRMWQSEAQQDKLPKRLTYATPANELAKNVTEEGEQDWMALAIDLYVSRFGRRCVTCWNDVADEDVYLVTRDGVHFLVHSACKPQ